MNSYAAFIEEHRQVGSTTELVKAALGVDGYIVVHSLDMKKHLLRKHPTVNPERVLTLGQLKSGSAMGREKRPIFVDAAVLCCVQEN